MVDKRGKPPPQPPPSNDPDEQKSWVTSQSGEQPAWVDRNKTGERSWISNDPDAQVQQSGAWVDESGEVVDDDEAATGTMFEGPPPEAFSPNDSTRATEDPNATIAETNPRPRRRPTDESGEVPPTPSAGLETIDEPPPSGTETIQDLPRAEAGLGRKLGDFVLEKKIGQGGMGEVYRARQVSLDRVVAIKILPKALAAQPDFIGRFEREARAAASLIHPNVIQMYAYGIDDGRPYFAMEYVEGEDLAQRLKRQRPIPFADAIEILASVAGALSIAHEKGVIHRDIKPSNIMIDKNGIVKVMDFGLAKAMSSGTELTQSGLIMGTPNYLSPEQGRGDPLDGRSDLYSLGVVLYEMVTGSLPFKADTPAGLIFKHVYEDPEPPSARNDKVPAQLERMCLRLLSKAPEDRPESARKILDELKLYRTGEVPLMAEPRADDSPARVGDETEVDARPAKRASERNRAAPKKIEPAPVAPKTVIIERGGWGPVLFMTFLLLVLGGGGGAYYLHTTGQLEELLGRGVKPVFFKEPWSTAELRGATIQIESAAGRFSLPATVKPGAYALRLERRGQEPVTFQARLDASGVIYDVGDGKPLAGKTLEWLPLKDLRDTYETAMSLITAAEEEARRSGNFDRVQLGAAKGQLESAIRMGLDPEYRRPAAPNTLPGDELPTAQQLTDKAAELLKETKNVALDAPERARDLAEKHQWRALQELVKAQGALAAREFWQKQAELARNGIARADALANETQAALLRGDVAVATTKLQQLRDQDPEDRGRDRIARLAKIQDGAEKIRAPALQLAAKKGAGEAELVSARAQLEKWLTLLATLGEQHDKDVAAALDDVGRRLTAAKDLSGIERELDDAIAKSEWQRALEIAWKLQRADKSNKAAADALPKIHREIRAAEVRAAIQKLDDALCQAADHPEGVLALIERGDAASIERKSIEELAAAGARVVKSRHVDHAIVDAANGDVTVRARWIFELTALGEPARPVELPHVLGMKKVGAEWRFTSFAVEGATGVSGPPAKAGGGGGRER